MTSAEPIQSFRELPARQKAEIAALFIRKEYEPDEYVFFEGNDPVQLWFVEQEGSNFSNNSDTGRMDCHRRVGGDLPRRSGAA